MRELSRTGSTAAASKRGATIKRAATSKWTVTIERAIASKRTGRNEGVATNERTVAHECAATEGHAASKETTTNEGTAAHKRAAAIEGISSKGTAADEREDRNEWWRAKWTPRLFDVSSCLCFFRFTYLAYLRYRYIKIYLDIKNLSQEGLLEHKYLYIHAFCVCSLRNQFISIVSFSFSRVQFPFQSKPGVRSLLRSRMC